MAIYNHIIFIIQLLLSGGSIQGLGFTWTLMVGRTVAHYFTHVWGTARVRVGQAGGA